MSKKNTNKAADPSVLGSLKSTRPSRIGGERRGATKASGATKPPGATKARPTKSPPRAAAAKSAAVHRPDAPLRQAPPPRPDRCPGVVGTAVRAAGELAQIGLTVTGQILKRAASRLPRP
jgi:hypothetical protein